MYTHIYMYTYIYIYMYICIYTHKDICVLYARAHWRTWQLNFFFCVECCKLFQITDEQYNTFNFWRVEPFAIEPPPT